MRKEVPIDAIVQQQQRQNKVHSTKAIRPQPMQLKVSLDGLRETAQYVRAAEAKLLDAVRVE